MPARRSSPQVESTLHNEVVMNPDLPDYDLTLSAAHWAAVHQLDGLLDDALELEAIETAVDLAEALLAQVTIPGCTALKAIALLDEIAHRHDPEQTLAMLKDLRRKSRAHASATAGTLGLYRSLAVQGGF